MELPHVCQFFIRFKTKYLYCFSKEEETQKYVNKLQDLSPCDPYTAPASVFQSLKTVGHHKCENLILRDQIQYTPY